VDGRDHALRLHRGPDGFAAADGNVVLIGQASPRRAAHVRRRLGLELPVLADDDRRSYRAAGARCRGAPVGDAAQLGGANWAAGCRAARRQGRLEARGPRAGAGPVERARPRGVDT
jgi:hypothetical protein